MKESKYLGENQTILSILKRVEKLNAFTENDILSIMELGKLREYEAGEIIIREGEFDCWIYFLITGELEAIKEGQIVSVLRRCGDIFGEMSVLDASPRSATIRAATQSLVLAFDGSILDRKQEKGDVAFCFTTLRLFAEVLVKRLRDTTEENIRLKERVADLETRLMKYESKESTC